MGRGWYSKPACAEMLDSAFRRSLEATAHVNQRRLEQALQTMEEAWPEGEEHMAKLSINALVGLFAATWTSSFFSHTPFHSQYERGPSAASATAYIGAEGLLGPGRIGWTQGRRASVHQSIP